MCTAKIHSPIYFFGLLFLTARFQGSSLIEVHQGSAKVAIVRANYRYMYMYIYHARHRFLFLFFLLFFPLVSLFVSPSPLPFTTAMRLSVVAIAAALVVVAHAQSDYFPFALESPCIAACNDVCLCFHSSLPIFLPASLQLAFFLPTFS